jgi:hypothetical protein
MPVFLMVYSESVLAGASSMVDDQVQVSSNDEFSEYVNTMNHYGLLFLHIVLRHNVVGDEEGWIESCLQLPDLTRFHNLEKVWIEFDGNIQASGAVSCLTLPNKVWMFAVRNGSLDLDVKFGCASEGNFRENPISVVALRNTRFSGAIHWETEQGTDNPDFGLVMWTCGNTIVYNTANLVFGHINPDLNVCMRHHTLGSKGDLYQEGDSPNIVYHSLMDNLEDNVYLFTNHYIDPIDELEYFLTNMD